jgi:hypothetical protein
MKNVTLFILALLCLPVSIFAQQDEQLEDKVKAACSTLDFSKITTGILYESVPNYVSYEYMNGSYVADSIANGKGSFVLAYGMLDKGHVGTSSMKGISTFWGEADKLEVSDTAFLGLIRYRYSRLDPAAASSGLLSFSDDHLYDNSGSGQSIYLTDTTFIFSALRSVFDTNTVKFYFPDSLIFANVGVNTANLQIDFGNGNGFQTLNLNQLYSVTYATDSLHLVQLKYTLADGRVLVAQTMIIVEPHTNLQGGALERGGTQYESSSYNASKKLDGLTIYYWYNTICDEQKIRKPLIIIEGFDELDENTWSLVMNEKGDGLLDNSYDIPTNTPLSDYIHSGLYDIFYINFDEGGLDIR